MVLELRGPVVISCEITTLCPGRCPGCSNVFPHSDAPGYLSASQWGEIVEKLSPFVQEFRITGGEPTMRDDLFEILSCLERAEKYYHIFTNGLWNNPLELIKKFQSLAYIGSFLVSLHGSDCESHKSFSGEDNFEKVVETIRLLVSAGFEVNTNAVLTRSNMGKIEEITNFSCEIGAKRMVFNRFIGNPIEGITLSAGELKEALTIIDKLQKQGYNCIIGNCIPYCFYPSTSSGCLAGITFGTIDPFGNLRPCNHSPHVVGNILSKNVTELWKSKGLKKWRENIPGECRRCSKITFCPSGCKAMADLLKEPKDSLIMGKVKTKRQSEKILEIHLEENLCPSPKYIVREEDFGISLIHYTQVIPISHKAKKIVEMIDGNTPLEKFEKKHGGAALSFIYSLYVRNFIDFIPKGS